MTLRMTNSMVDMSKLNEDIKDCLESVDDTEKLRSIIVVGFDHQGNPKASYTGDIYDLTKAVLVLQAEFNRWYFGIDD